MPRDIYAPETKAKLVADGSAGIPSSSKSCSYATRTLDDAANPSAISNVVLIDGPDEDEDGFPGATEAIIGTDPLDGCANTTTNNDESAPDARPPDFNDDTFVDTFDIGQVTVRFGLAVPPAPTRVEIGPDPPDGFIDTGDIGRITGLFGQSCIPP